MAVAMAARRRRKNPPYETRQMRFLHHMSAQFISKEESWHLTRVTRVGLPPPFGAVFLFHA